GDAIRRDADVRVDGREGLADVSTVRRAISRLAVVRIDGKIDVLEVLTEEGGHGDVGLEWIVDDRVRCHLHRAARGRGRALGAPFEAPQQLLTVILRGRPQVELRGRVLRDDVGLVAALGDDAVYARVGLELLAHLVERDEELDHGVEGIDPAPRPGRGVRGFSKEVALDLDDAEARPP